MKEFFDLFISATFTTNIFIVTVFIIRALFRNISKNSRLVLWGMVAVKLLMPFPVESKFSLIPEKIVGNKVTQDAFNVVSSAVVEKQCEVSSFFSVQSMFIVVWAVGLIFILSYGALSFHILRKNVRDAVKKEGNIYCSEKVFSPFVLGIVRPKIYIPFSVSGDAYDCIVAHEKSHIKNLDHITKLMSFVLVAIHWFNPLVWVCFKLITKDLELACDERVIRGYSTEKRKLYAKTLLDCAIKENRGLIYPVAFGEVSIKERIKSVVKYRKTMKIILLLFVGIALLAFTCFATVPKLSDNTVESVEEASYSVTERDESANEEPATEAERSIVVTESVSIVDLENCENTTSHEKTYEVSTEQETIYFDEIEESASIEEATESTTLFVPEIIIPYDDFEYEEGTTYNTGITTVNGYIGVTLPSEIKLF